MDPKDKAKETKEDKEKAKDLEDYGEVDGDPINDDVDDEEDFDPLKYIEGLIKLCRYTQKLSDREKGVNVRRRQSPLIKALNNYDKLVTSDTALFSDFSPQFESVFAKHYDNIMDEDDQWLEGGKVTIKFADDVKSRSRAKNEKCIYLSSFYRMAAEMYDAHSKDPIVDGKRNEYESLPVKFMRYLYLIFIEITDDGDDKETLGNHLNKIEDALGISDRHYIEDYDISKGLFSGNFADGLKKIFGLVLKSAAKEGMAGGEDMNFDSIADAITGMFGEEDFFSGIVDQLSKCKDRKDITKVLLDRIKNPKLFNKIEEATGKKINTEDIQKVLEDEKMSGTLDSIMDHLSETKGRVKPKGESSASSSSGSSIVIVDESGDKTESTSAGKEEDMGRALESIEQLTPEE